MTKAKIDLCAANNSSTFDGLGNVTTSVHDNSGAFILVNEANNHTLLKRHITSDPAGLDLPHCSSCFRAPMFPSSQAIKVC